MNIDNADLLANVCSIHNSKRSLVVKFDIIIQLLLLFSFSIYIHQLFITALFTTHETDYSNHRFWSFNFHSKHFLYLNPCTLASIVCLRVHTLKSSFDIIWKYEKRFVSKYNISSQVDWPAHQILIDLTGFWSHSLKSHCPIINVDNLTVLSFRFSPSIR